jgi:1,2-diacylglycerol 3-alpha-glucosyltransferase
MNIALFSDSYVPEVNGIATSVKSLYDLLKKNGHNVYVVTTTGSKKTTFDGDIIRIPGIELKKLYDYKAAFIFNFKAYKILQKLNLDICHINTDAGIGQFGFLVAKRLKIASVYTYHTMYEDYTYYATKGYFDRFSKRAIKEYSKSQLERMNEIISPSEKTMNYIRSIGIRKYVNVVPTGFDFTRFEKVSREDKKVEELREKIGLKNEKVIVTIGRIAKEKSFDLLLRAFAKFKATYSDDVRFLLVGDGPARADLELLAKQLNVDKDVIFIGKVDPATVQYYYALGDVFVNASKSETQGLTFMEAMAAHIVVLCRFDNNLLGVIDNNVNGFFFVDEDDFKDKLKEILHLDDEALKKIKDRAYASIEPFGVKTFYNNIMMVYRRAMRENW